MSEQTWERDKYGLTLRLAMGVVLCVGWVEEMGGPRRWRWTLEYEGYGGRAARMATGEPCASEGEACEAGLVAAADLGALIKSTAEGEARRIKQAAQDADDAALVAAHGEVAWEIHVEEGLPTSHTATVAGHYCRVEVDEDGFGWELDADIYKRPEGGWALDLETAKLRAAAAALRQPCKRWRVTMRDQTAEVWAVTHKDALCRAGMALGINNYGRPYDGEALEVRL